MTDGKPDLYVCCCTDTRNHGPGRKWTMMAHPGSGQTGEGRIWTLTPQLHALTLLNKLLDARRGNRSVNPRLWESYRTALESGWNDAALAPGKLIARPPTERYVVVADGDTVWCACSAQKAADEMCHRSWAAPALTAAGWSVILDGTPYQATLSPPKLRLP